MRPLLAMLSLLLLTAGLLAFVSLVRRGAAIPLLMLGAGLLLAALPPASRPGPAGRALIVLLLPALVLVADPLWFPARSHALTVNGVARSYRVYEPASLDRGKPAPLVMAFHGFSQNGRIMERLTRLDRLAERERFVVVYPEGLRARWNDGRQRHPSTADDVGFVRAVIDDIGARVAIDRGRVFALGFSNGGFFLVGRACELTDAIAAVAVVAAGVGPELQATCAAGRLSPALVVLGTEDPMVPYGGRGRSPAPRDSGRVWAERNGCDPAPHQESVALARDDGMPVTRTAFGGCLDDAEAETLVIEGGGHTWPSGRLFLPRFIVGRTSHAIDATEEAWRFFQKHPRRGRTITDS